MRDEELELETREGGRQMISQTVIQERDGKGGLSGGGDVMSRSDVKITEVENQIRKVEKLIQIAEEEAKNAVDNQERVYWWKKEEDLRKEKEDLRKKDMMLLEAQIASTTKSKGPVLSMSFPGLSGLVRLSGSGSVQGPTHGGG